MRQQRYHPMLSLALVVMVCCTSCPAGPTKSPEPQRVSSDDMTDKEAKEAFFQKHCAEFCKHLRILDCPHGTPSSHGRTCEDLCLDTNLAGHPIPRDQAGNLVTSERFLSEQSCAVLESVTVREVLSYAVIKVFYATDRNRTLSTQLAEFFGTGRGELSYGICEVSIPRDHRMGALESPSILKLEFREDPKKHVVLLSIVPLEKNQYFAGLSTRIRASSGKNAFIFVHGYNVSFEDAARRTAQIAYDLGFDGAAVFYSWPSQGTSAKYLVDETNIEWTQANLRRFLDDFVARTDADNIYLIAHSMGNRALTRAFSALVSDKSALRQRFREVILTAPDIDADVFKRDIGPQIGGDHPPITLYASSEDIALLASKKFHGYPRAGDAGDGLVIVPGIDTIDATGVDTSFLKHSYYAEVRSVLADIFYLIRAGKRPNQRFGLEPIDTKAGRYWRFRK